MLFCSKNIKLKIAFSLNFYNMQLDNNLKNKNFDDK